MKPSPTILLAAAALATIAPTYSAEKGPSFAPPNWHFMLDSHIPVATDILIVNEGQEIDGKVTVEEVLYGPKKVGDELDFPDLAKFAPAEARTTIAPHPMFHPMEFAESGPEEAPDAASPDPAATPREDEFVPEVVPAGRMMVFLVPEGMTPGTPHYDFFPGGKPPPQPGIESQVALLKGPRVFLPSGLYLEPEKLSLSERPETLSELRQRITAVLHERALLDECAATEDPAKRAALAAPLTSSGTWTISDRARHILVRCGPAAIPHLETLLSNEKVAWQRDLMAQEIFRALRTPGLQDTARETFTPLLLRLADGEIAFWKKTAPTLSPRWWTEHNSPDGPSALLIRYTRTMLIVDLLGELKTPAALAKVRDIRDFCESQPALKNSGAPYSIPGRCSVALGES